MAQFGCPRCGVVVNPEIEFVAVPGLRQADSRGPSRRVCPECGAAMPRISLSEAMALVRERAEAERWRAQAREHTTRRPAS